MDLCILQGLCLSLPILHKMTTKPQGLVPASGTALSFQHLSMHFVMRETSNQLEGSDMRAEDLFPILGLIPCTQKPTAFGHSLMHFVTRTLLAPHYGC